MLKRLKILGASKQPDIFTEESLTSMNAKYLGILKSKAKALLKGKPNDCSC
jgi:hypothetical protein